MYSYTYTLKGDYNDMPVTQEVFEKNFQYFSEPMIIENIKWFCSFRWMVITVFIMFGLLSFSPDFFYYVSLKPFQKWPFFVAVILILGNVLFLYHILLYTRSKTPIDLKINLWSQIVFDLLILTVVVHFIGSLETTIPFAYLFHIVLACIFFSRPKSLLVTAIASLFYVVCIIFEKTGLVSAAGIYVNSSLRENIESTPWITVHHVISTIMILLVDPALFPGAPP